jgi:hypothetical protein
VFCSQTFRTDNGYKITVVWQIQFKANKNSELRREAPFVIFVSHNKPNEASQCLRSPTLLNRYKNIWHYTT